MDEAALKHALLHVAGNCRDQMPVGLKERIVSYAIDNRLLPESRDLLAAVAEYIDNESDLHRTWELIDDPSQTGVYSRPPEWNQLIRAVSKNLHRSTISYFDIGNHESTSGVLVQIGERIFIATTAHSVPKRMKDVFLVGHSVTESKIPVLNFGRGTSDRLDVAFIEIDAGGPARIIKSPISLDRISVCGWGTPGMLVMVFGFPSKLATTEKEKRAYTITMKGQAWPFPVLEPDDWGVLTDSADRIGGPDPSLDVFIAYPQDEPVGQIPPYAERSTHLANPGGLSGCGYWIATNNPEKVWSSDKYKLFAIQSRWWGRGRYLQGIQIVYWLALVWKCQSDLRLEIEDAFPDVDFGKYAQLF